MNKLFEAVLAEEAPMYDTAIITANGTEYWKHEDCHKANNCHSSTKFIVATAIGQLWDDGKLKLTDRLIDMFSSDELPENYDEKWKYVTIMNLLQHKTGFTEMHGDVDDDNSLYMIGDDFLKFVISKPLGAKPGTFYKYSDASYYLLGRVIGKVSGIDPVTYIRNYVLKPVKFHQWAMACCPQGYPICGGGFFSRSDDMARLGYVYACDGVTEQGERLVSEKWIENAMNNDFACTRFRDTDIFLKTGSRGQMVAFSRLRKAGAAWHGCAFNDDNGKRNDRLLVAFNEYLDEKFGPLTEEQKNICGISRIIVE